MPLNFRILSQHNLVYVSCTGRVTVDQVLTAFKSYATHPDFEPGQTQLLDLSNVTDYERDFTKIMSLQAQQTDVYLKTENRPFLLFIAPNELTRGMAMTAVRSWQDLDGVIPLVLSSLAEALEVLSLQDLSRESLLESAQ